MTAKRLIVFCEGQSEQGFCSKVLTPHLFPGGDGQVHTLPVGEKRHRHLRGLGGRKAYASFRKFILSTIKANPRVWLTTMLFADPSVFRDAFEECEPAIERLQAIANSVTSIEQIDDGRETAPSKRIIEAIPQYAGRKATVGPDLVACIGLPRVREKCPHFDAWIRRLEAIDWAG